MDPGIGLGSPAPAYGCATACLHLLVCGGAVSRGRREGLRRHHGRIDFDSCDIAARGSRRDRRRASVYIGPRFYRSPIHWITQEELQAAPDSGQDIVSGPSGDSGPRCGLVCRSARMTHDRPSALLAVPMLPEPERSARYALALRLRKRGATPVGSTSISTAERGIEIFVEIPRFTQPCTPTAGHAKHPLNWTGAMGRRRTPGKVCRREPSPGVPNPVLSAIPSYDKSSTAMTCGCGARPIAAWHAVRGGWFGWTDTSASIHRRLFWQRRFFRMHPKALLGRSDATWAARVPVLLLWHCRQLLRVSVNGVGHRCCGFNTSAFPRIAVRRGSCRNVVRALWRLVAVRSVGPVCRGCADVTAGWCLKEPLWSFVVRSSGSARRALWGVGLGHAGVDRLTILTRSIVLFSKRKKRPRALCFVVKTQRRD